MKLFSSRTEYFSIMPIKSPRLLQIMRSRSNPANRAMSQKLRESIQMYRVLGQTHPRCRAYQHPYRRSRRAVPISSELQTQRYQHYRSCRNSRKHTIQQRLSQRQKMHRDNAPTIYASAPNNFSHSAKRHQNHRNKGNVRMCNRQRNPAQRNHLCGIFHIVSSRKSGLRTICRSGNRR